MYSTMSKVGGGWGGGRGFAGCLKLANGPVSTLLVRFAFPAFISLLLSSLKGIGPITVVTHRDKLKSDEECDNALYEASAATGSSPSHTFFMTNYTKESSQRNPKTERMTFDILHYALLTAERAVKIMKQQQKNKEEDEMVRALEGTSVSGHVPPDSADGNFIALVKIYDVACVAVGLVRAKSKVLARR